MKFHKLMLSPIGLLSNSTHAYALKGEVLKSETQSGEYLVIVKIPFTIIVVYQYLFGKKSELIVLHIFNKRMF